MQNESSWSYRTACTNSNTRRGIKSWSSIFSETGYSLILVTQISRRSFQVVFVDISSMIWFKASNIPKQRRWKPWLECDLNLIYVCLITMRNPACEPFLTIHIFGVNEFIDNLTRLLLSSSEIKWFPWPLKPSNHSIVIWRGL